MLLSIWISCSTWSIAPVAVVLLPIAVAIAVPVVLKESRLVLIVSR